MEAKPFNAAGYATLSYDHRNWGSSDGTPRQHTNLFQQVEDLSDAITYLESRSDIDANRIALWGLGHGAGIAIGTGAHNKRVQAIIGAHAFFSGEVDVLRYPPGALEAAWKERAGRIDNPGLESTYVPTFAETMEDTLQNPLASIIGSPQGFGLWKMCKQLSDAAGTLWKNMITLESLYWQSKWEPTASVHLISPRPLFWIATDAPLFPNYQSQMEVYKRALEPKQFRGFRSLEEASSGPLYEDCLREQVDFLKKWV